MLTSNISLRADLAEGVEVSPGSLSLSVIVPTRNEAGNIEKLLSRLKVALKDTLTEVLFVDDSTDETPQVVEGAIQQFPELNIRLIHREPKERTGGLGGAVLIGLQAAQSEFACVMDGDLQHPPDQIPVLLNTAKEKQVDLVVATRRNQDSQITGLNVARNQISRVLDLAARILFPRQLQGVSDPLTGFFLVRIKALNLKELHPNGFKILLEILIRNPRLRKAEVPFHFEERFAGESKASAKEVWNYLKLLWTLRFGEGSLRFILFALVGLSGILINSVVLYFATSKLNIYYLISASLATVASTIWNFSLVEIWVFRAGDSPQGRLRRLLMFFVMNTAALALRSPIIYILTSLLGVYYVVSNLISLALMTFVRYLLADKIIWGKPSSTMMTVDLDKKLWKPTLGKIYSYNIHNVVTVVSQGELPELEPFRVYHTIQQPTIRVRIGMPKHPKKGSVNSNYLHYREMFGHLGFEVGIQMGEQVEVVASPMMRFSPHVLYTNVVEPILRWTFVKKGYALVHGATLAFGQQAYLITARTDTGKTTTLLKILAHQRRDSDRAAFLSDDMTIISPNGIATTYPKPLTISAHTLRAINADRLSFREKISLPFQSRIHSRTGRRVAAFISKTHLPAATINMVLQMLVPPPKYFVNKLVPRVKVAQAATLTGMFIIERGGEGIQPMDNLAALEILLTNCEDAYGFPPYEDIKSFLYNYNGIDLRQKEQEIIRKAFNALPATRICSSNLNWWCQIPPFVDQSIAVDISCDDHRAIPSTRTATSEAVGTD